MEQEEPKNVSASRDTAFGWNTNDFFVIAFHLKLIDLLQFDGMSRFFRK